MIFNKVNRHELSVRFPWSAVTCSSAGSHGSSQLRFSVFAFMCSSSVFAYLSSSRCWVFLCFSTCGSHQAVTLGAATVCSRFPPPPPLPLFFSFHWLLSVLTGAWNGGSWLGCGDLPAMGAVFYLGAGWPQWKPLDIPGTHLPLKRGSGLIFAHWQR